MATISFRKKELERFIGKEIPLEQIVNSFEMLGMPVDKYDDEEIAADITNDRVDMFSVEGAGRAIGQFLGIIGPKEYLLSKSDLVLNVEEVKCRPFIVGFVAKGVKLDDDMIRSLIMAQEKIHETFGRKRRKIAIGIHDADKVTGPLYYKAVKDIKFIPLDTDHEMNISEILNQHPKGKEYSHLFDGVDEYPMFMDSKGVLSFPPIINSERTRLTEKTTNLLFDITGTSEDAIRIVANIFATSLFCIFAINSPFFTYLPI
jgi:phenylalanyl-tRNA synthetase beta chain